MEGQIQFDYPDTRKGYVCKCCGSYCKLYSRSFNSNMAITLITLYKNKVNGFVHLEDFMREKGYKRCGDASYLTHYGFLERLSGKREDNSKRNGYYKITGRGILFSENKLKVKEKFIIYNNKLEGFEGKEVGIKEVLKKKFSYDDLMNS